MNYAPKLKLSPNLTIGGNTLYRPKSYRDKEQVTKYNPQFTSHSLPPEMKRTIYPKRINEGRIEEIVKED